MVEHRTLRLDGREYTVTISDEREALSAAAAAGRAIVGVINKELPDQDLSPCEMCIRDSPYGKHMQFFLNEDEKKLALTWVVADDIPEDEALLYASDLACEFNDIVAVQDSSIALSNDNSLGGLYDQYALIVGILPEGTENDPSQWFVNVELAAGENNACLLYTSRCV